MKLSKEVQRSLNLHLVLDQIKRNILTSTNETRPTFWEQDGKLELLLGEVESFHQLTSLSTFECQSMIIRTIPFVALSQHKLKADVQMRATGIQITTSAGITRTNVRQAVAQYFQNIFI